VTVIATFGIDNLPVLIGDLLISRETGSATSVGLPTIGHYNSGETANNDGKPVGLSQKVNIINDKLAIAWAGSQIHAKYVLKEIKRIVGTTSVDYDRIKRILESLPREVFKDLSICGIFANNGECGAFHFNAVEMYTENVGDIYAAGSGLHHIYEVLEMPMEYKFIEPSENPMALPIGKAIAICNLLLGAEIRSRTTLNNLYGGAFEIAITDGHTVKKIGDILHIFMNAEIGNGTEISGSFYSRMIKQTYIGRDLLMRSTQTSTDEKGNTNLDEQDMHIVMPVYKNGRTSKYSINDLPDMNSTILCINLFVSKEGNPLFVKSRVKHAAIDHQAVQFDGGKDLSGIKLDTEFFSDFLKDIPKE